MSLTPRERVTAQIHHQETDRVPYVLGFEEDVAEGLDAYYGGPAWRDLIDNDINRRMGLADVLDVHSAGERTFTDPYGAVWRVDRRPYHLEEPALKSPSLKGYQFPDVDALFELEWKEETLRSFEQHPDHFNVVGFGMGLFERPWSLRGFDESLMDAAANEGFYLEMIDRLAEHHMAIVERLLEFPIDGIMFCDDWGYQQGVLLGPGRWRRLLKPYYARMYARVHEAGKYTLSHCCGGVREIIPDLIEIGLDVLQSVQPEPPGMDPYQLKRDFGDQITFWGGLGSQSTIPFGTPDEIRSEIARLCREMGRGGGYILTPAKPLQPGTPIENAAAVVEAFLEQAGTPFP